MKAFLALICAFALVAAETPAPGSPAYVNDNNALNYALTLEQLEATFYNTALTNLTQQDFANAGFNQTIYNWIQIIREHENMHVSAITAALNGRCAHPVRPCTYNFPTFNVSTFLQTAMTFEAVGASAYVGAISGITDTALLTYAASVATVEARHSAFLNELNGKSPFPNATEPSLTPTQVAAIIADFLASCPDTLILPVPADTFRSNQTKNEAYNNQTRSPAYLNDNAALNYALTLENLEAAFYNQYLCNATVSDFANAGINATYYDWIQMIRMHENAHVAALRMVLSSRGAVPVEPCTYNFTSNATVAEFLATARTLENVGVSAYIGAINTFSSETLLAYAASIATVEARHAAFLNEITGQNPFPNATDPALTPSAVLSLASQFIVNCSAQIVLPVPADTFRPNSSSTGSASTGSSTAVATGAVATGASSTGSQATTGHATTGHATTGTVATGTAATTGNQATGATGASTGSQATGAVATGTPASTGNQATGPSATTGATVTASATGSASTGNQATGAVATGASSTGPVATASASTTGATVTASATGNGATASATTGTAATGSASTGNAATGSPSSTANAGTTGLVSGGVTTDIAGNSGLPSNSGSTTGIQPATNPEQSSAMMVVASAALSCLALLFI